MGDDALQNIDCSVGGWESDDLWGESEEDQVSQNFLISEACCIGAQIIDMAGYLSSQRGEISRGVRAGRALIARLALAQPALRAGPELRAAAFIEI